MTLSGAFNLKWFHRKQREYVEQVAIDIFGSKLAMKEHFGFSDVNLAMLFDMIKSR